MKEIVLDNPHRQKHFQFFLNFEQPHFNVCASLNVTKFRSWQKENGHPFNISMVYFTTKAASSIPEFRWRIREGRIYEHSEIRPSFTVPTEASSVFSFCTVDYRENFPEFLASAKRVQGQMKSEPSLNDEPGCDDYFFMSSLPWISFTSVSHAMGKPAKDSVPRITWGRLEEKNGELFMPLSVQAHHALVDGSHMGQLFQSLETAFREPESFVKTMPG